MIFQVCNEQKVKQIRPSYEDTSVISKRDAEDLVTSSSLTNHCSLPEDDQEFQNFTFVYNKGTDLEEIIKSIKTYNKSLAGVLLAKPLKYLHMIIFQMNRAAYLWVCQQ